MDPLLSEFLDYLRYERNRSPHTVAGYRSDLELFLDYIRRTDEGLSWDAVDSDTIRGWMEEMMDKGSSATSINRRLSSLRSFFRYAVMRRRLPRDPAYHVKGPKKAKPLPQYLQEGEMDRLLDDGYWTDSFSDLRARTIILLFYSTGIRLSELTSLNDTSVDFRGRAIKVLGKRNKERMVPFGEELSLALGEYILRRKEVFGSPGPLFLSDKGQRMSPPQVRRTVIGNLSKVTTMKKRSPHVLRHTFATAMLNSGAGLESIKNLLGHESVSTTEIYTHTTFEQLRKVYGRTHPRGGGDGDGKTEE